jgi:hypothetical protein
MRLTQWGMEFGKVLSQPIVAELDSGIAPGFEHYSSTNGLIRRYRNREGSFG